MRRAVLVAALALCAAAPARAAYDPRFEVRVDPAAPGVAASLTATVTQAQGESATQSERVRFPAAFTFNPAFQVTRCTAAEERDASCPDASRIGMAEAQTMFGDFTGPVHLTEDFRLVVFLRGYGGLVQQEVSGYMVLNPDGTVESVLDNLPDVQATRAAVTFDSGPRSLILTPRTCGDYAIDGVFTSHNGERAERRSTVQVAGCDTSPRIERASVRRGLVSWSLSDAGSATLVELQRRERAGRFIRWRSLSETRAAAARGTNTVRVRLPRTGRLRVVLTALSTGGRPADVARVAIR